VSLPTAIGRVSSCAEQVAVGTAITRGCDHDDLRTCVAVSYPAGGHDAETTGVIPPCGACRELLVDYGPMRVLEPVDDEVRAVDAAELLPTRTW